MLECKFHMTDLDAISTDDLIVQIEKRFDVAIFGGLRYSDVEKKKYYLKHGYRGSPMEMIGLIHLLSGHVTNSIIAGAVAQTHDAKDKGAFEP